MGMFGRILGRHESGHASMPKGGATVTIPATAPKTPARRGAFGRGWLTPERLQVIGATLQQLDGQQGAIDGALSNIDERSVAERQRQEDDQQRKALQAAYGALPENLRPFGPILTPEALSRAVMPPPPEYEIDDAGRPYTIQNGQVQYGQGQVYRRPPQSSVPSAPSGYRVTRDGNLEPIPGGPADLRQNAEGRARGDQLDSSARQLDNAISVIDQALPNVNDGSAGLWGQVTRGVGGTAAYDLNQQLEPVRAILSFENLQEMRRNSTTGGALGSIAVRELELLGSTVRSLDTAQGPAQLRAALRDVRVQLQRTRQAIAAARADLSGSGQQQQSGQQQPVLRWNPQTGQLE